MQGTKDKGAPLKIQMCKCIVKLVKEQAVPYPACKEGVEAPSNADIGWALSSLSGCNKPSEDGKPWIMVATIRRLWMPAFRGFGARGQTGAGHLWRTSRRGRQTVAELSGLPLKGKGKGKSRVSPEDTFERLLRLCTQNTVENILRGVMLVIIIHDERLKSQMFEAVQFWDKSKPEVTQEDRVKGVVHALFLGDRRTFFVCLIGRM